MRRKVAVCVGINDYPGTGADLSGCVNDALDMQKALSERGYTVRTLLNSGATKAAILNELRIELGHLSIGDRFVFSFSGHGTWLPDRDGDESDMRDEALCCHDYDRGGLLTDDEMHALFQSRRYGVRVTVISDSCHSGTVARFMHTSPQAQGKMKFLSPAVFTDLSADEAAQIEVNTRNAVSRPGTVLISGCADHEYSYDASFGGRPNGAMTYHLLQVLRNGEPSVRGAYELLRTRLPSAQHPQTPQLGATYYQKRTHLL